MAVQFQATRCGECGANLDEEPHLPTKDRGPCPSCGSKARAFAVGITSSVELHSKVGAIARRPPGRRWFMKQVVGSDLHRKTGVWMRLERVIDRARNWYHEKITDPRSGTVVHECSEPLAEHRGHGAARKQGAAHPPPAP